MNKNVLISIIIGAVVVIAIIIYFMVDPFAPDKQRETQQPAVTQTQPEPSQPAESKSETMEEAKPPAKPKTKQMDEAEIYVVKEGDTLESIAEEYFGNKKGWYKIFAANESEIDCWDSVYIGQKLVIPQE